jgi:hypothetical protein
MQMNAIKCFVIVAALFMLTPVPRANADSESIAAELPPTVDARETSLGAKGVAHACLTMLNTKDSLPCNPALMARWRKTGFIGQATFGNSYESLSTANKILSGDGVDTPLLQSLFQRNQIIEMQAQGELAFWSRGLGVQFVPAHIDFYSIVRNQAYPVIGLSALQEQSLNVLGGHALTDDLLLGARLRFIERKFVRNDFSLFDAAAEDGKILTQTHSQKAVVAEPSLAYLPRLPWNPSLALAIRDVGYFDQAWAHVPSEPRLEAGIGVAPDLRWGRLELALNYRPAEVSSPLAESLRSGVSYSLGHLTGLLGLGSDYVSAGILFGVENLSGGLIYTSTRSPFAEKSAYAQSIYSQLGIRI